MFIKFDLGNLLCSFLLGAGYDAYVVCGYAPRFITLRDQSKIKCPIAAQESSTPVSNEGIPSAEAKGEEDEANSYVPPDNSVKNSKYLAEQAEIKRIAVSY